MKKPITLILTALICHLADAQVLRPFTPRYSNTSVRGNIVFVSNSIIHSSGGTTSENPPSGSSTNNSRVGVNIDVDAAPAGTTFINWGAAWRYLANNTRPAGWETVGFNHAAWPSGNSELGYGDGDEATVIPYGGSASNKYITTLFRHVVNIPDPTSFLNFKMDIEYDDGFVVYVNGVEVSRGNMPAGAVTNATLASSAIEDQIATVLLPTSVFVAGNNTIAVEIHQSGGNSTDLSFNMRLEGSMDPTFNSSSADLELSTCSEVLWAGLYWGATQGNSGSNTSWITGETTVKLKTPGATNYVDITAAQVDYHNNTLVPGLPHTGYRCYADVTSLLNTTDPNGTYTVANMATPAGIQNSSAGWTIVVVYANPSEIPRNLTVFDGSAIMDGGSPAMDVSFSGFLTPPSGPVSCELGAVVFDGDRAQQDGFSFRQDGAATFTNLTATPVSNSNDMWNSTISYKGVNVTTRNPMYLNTHGYDADIILIPNASNAVLGNNQTGATVRFSSPSENYFIQVLTTSISVFNPSFNLIKLATDVNGGALNPGDVIRYQIEYNNVGNDNSIGTAITDNIPGNTTYKPGSIVLNGVPKTDIAGDDEAEYDPVNNRIIFRVGTGANASSGGQVNTSTTGTVTFEVYSPSSCEVIACSNTISNSAHINYIGQTSSQNLYDSSGYISAGGCFVRGPVVVSLSGACSPMGDTILVNQCPATSVTIPIARYGGYQFYTAMPFSSSNVLNPVNPVTSTRTIYAFYDGAGACDDTIMVRVFVNPCPDIDDDDDGIPDYVEGNVPGALDDDDGDGVLNYADTDYPGFVDTNADGLNDNFDPSGDSDNDGVPNFYDPDFPGFVDTNGDGVNDNFDKDLDGIPNHLDLDSDNDGIPDVAECFGVDANGDGRIDNYSDTDNDGLSQNVDDNNTGVGGSGLGLIAIDTDGDGIPNYLDKDSDNDGVPDVVEAFGADANNDGEIDGYVDYDGDGFADHVDGDPDNDGVADNAANALLRTGADANNDGLCDSFPYKNMDGDSKPNPYDLDSDNDGITDVTEAQLPDADLNGMVDGTLDADGWSIVVSEGGPWTLPNRDGTGNPNIYDIDSDDDGIPDNIEGQCTTCYVLPSGVDSDGDGLDDAYDNISGFGGNGISVYNHDGDAYPDYLDLDTDGDGYLDIFEGNDFNLNGLPDDDVSLTGMDTDGDGLDDRFDNDNGSVEGTSSYMGNGGSFTGDANPGSITMVQQTYDWMTDRDWRNVDFLLYCDFVDFRAVLEKKKVTLKWDVIANEQIRDFEIERSTDGTTFEVIGNVAGAIAVNEVRKYTAYDDVNNLNTDKLFYRIKAVSVSGKMKYSKQLFLSTTNNTPEVQVIPNPVRGSLQLVIRAPRETEAFIQVHDLTGRLLFQATQKLAAGTNSLQVSGSETWSSGTYVLSMNVSGTIHQAKFIVQR